VITNRKSRKFRIIKPLINVKVGKRQFLQKKDCKRKKRGSYRHRQSRKDREHKFGIEGSVYTETSIAKVRMETGENPVMVQDRSQVLCAIPEGGEGGGRKFASGRCNFRQNKRRV